MFFPLLCESQRPLRLCVIFFLVRLLSFFPMSLPFDLAEATRHLSSCDEKLAALIAETAQFQTDMDTAQSPYEVLLESIAYQSISGKPAATISARLTALTRTTRPPP